MTTQSKFYKKSKKLFVSGITITAISLLGTKAYTVKADNLSAGYLMTQKVNQNNNLKPVSAVPTSIASAKIVQEENLDQNTTGSDKNQNSNVGKADTKLQEQVSIYYKDESGKALPDNEGKTSDHGTIEEGEKGKHFTAPEIKGYKLSYILINGNKVTDTDTASLDYTGADSNPTVTFVYAKVEKTYYRNKAAAVTVKYQDELGNTLADDIILNGYVGDGYTTGAKEVTGYTLKTRPDNATSFFGDYPQSVIYVYVKDNQDNLPNNDNNIGNDIDITDGTGKTNNLPKTKDHNGNAGNRKLINSGKNNGDPSNLTGSDNHNGHAATKVLSNKDTKQGEKLPQTGFDKQSRFVALLVGFMAIITSIVGAWFNRKKKE